MLAASSFSITTTPEPRVPERQSPQDAGLFAWHGDMAWASRFLCQQRTLLTNAFKAASSVMRMSRCLTSSMPSS
jgi:hypothetical protein